MRMTVSGGVVHPAWVGVVAEIVDSRSLTVVLFLLRRDFG